MKTKFLCIFIFSIALVATACSGKNEKHTPNIVEGGGKTTNATSPANGPQAVPNAAPNEVVALSPADKQLLSSLPGTKFIGGPVSDFSKVVKYGSGLIICMIEEGPGQKPPDGQNVNVHYHGQLLNGTTFDSSFERGAPLNFPLGRQKVIKGWDQGIALMNYGTKALMIVPPHLGYGPQANGSIPANSTLLFSVELFGAF